MDFINETWTKAPNWARLATFAALPTAGYISARFVDEYSSWRAMGPGGLPYDVRGYLVNWIMAAFFSYKETTSLAIYDKPEKNAGGWKKASEAEKANAQKSFLKGGLGQREGPRAASIHHTAPQREKNAGEWIDPEVRKAYNKAFDKLIEDNKDAIEIKTSLAEGHGPAMFLRPDYVIPTLITRGRGEVGHVHASDITGHCFLSFPDAKEVLEKGWGERHRVSGTLIPLGYTFLYTPRNIGEVETLIKIFEASIEYVKTSGRKE